MFEKDFDYSGFPDYFGAFEDRIQQHLLVHVYDQLVNASVKTSNMDLCKNITIDLYDTELLFVLSVRFFRMRFCIYTSEKSHHMKRLMCAERTYVYCTSPQAIAREVHSNFKDTLLVMEHCRNFLAASFIKVEFSAVCRKACYFMLILSLPKSSAQFRMSVRKMYGVDEVY